MWLFTTIGFFSVVQKPDEGYLTVRARVAADLERLRGTYMPELSATVAGAGTDYPYRATISHEAYAHGLAKMAQDIHYDNFKDAVAQALGAEREGIYAQVWANMLQLRDKSPTTARVEQRRRPRKRHAYGGVVFDAAGRILLREPSGHFGGYTWTFPKGRPQPGEEPAATARREVLEETGIATTIVAELPGSFAGETTENTYFLMLLDRDTGRQPAETAAIRWATEAEARRLIGQTSSTVGRARDLRVLEKACELFRQHIPPLGPQQLDAVLAFLPIFEQPGYEFGEFMTGPGLAIVREGQEPIPIPFFSYNADVLRFMETLETQRIIFPFDWPSWSREARRNWADPVMLADADLLTLRRLLTLHVRAERFNEEHLAEMLRSGHITAILRRLAQLRALLA